MHYTDNMTSTEISRLIASNQRAILEAQQKANCLSIENQQLQKVLNRRQVARIYGGFPVGHLAVIVSKDDKK